MSKQKNDSFGRDCNKLKPIILSLQHSGHRELAKEIYEIMKELQCKYGQKPSKSILQERSALYRLGSRTATNVEYYEKNPLRLRRIISKIVQRELRKLA